MAGICDSIQKCCSIGFTRLHTLHTDTQKKAQCSGVVLKDAAGVAAALADDDFVQDKANTIFSISLV